MAVMVSVSLSQTFACSAQSSAPHTGFPVTEFVTIPVTCVVAGVKDIVAKSIRSHNPFNTIKATLEGLKSLKDPEVVMKIRGKTEEETQQEVSA